MATLKETKVHNFAEFIKAPTVIKSSSLDIEVTHQVREHTDPNPQEVADFCDWFTVTAKCESGNGSGPVTEITVYEFGPFKSELSIQEDRINSWSDGQKFGTKGAALETGRKLTEMFPGVPVTLNGKDFDPASAQKQLSRIYNMGFDPYPIT